MASLELRIPPPVVALLAAVVMWLLSPLAVFGEAPFTRVWVAAVLAVAGAAFSIAGAVSFRRAGTTVNPLKPASASSLVVAGVYRVTRNPMYLGLFLLLAGWGVYLWSPLALPFPFAFAAYISRFQISPEEKALVALFGSEYTECKARVRRWL